jgi:hypothetical protein
MIKKEPKSPVRGALAVKGTKAMEDFQIGDSVTTMINNVKVHGVVESIQLKAGLVDVKIYEPGNLSHCLIVARKPEDIEHAEGKAQTA